MAKIEKADREQLLYVIAEEFGGDGKAWEQLAIEMVKAMSDTQAKEILGYIAKNWDIDTMGYEASTKKSKNVKKGTDWREESEQLYHQMLGFIDRGEFAKRGMSTCCMAGGGIELEVWNYDPRTGNDKFDDRLIFNISIAHDGVDDDWTGLQYRDNRDGYMVSVIRKHPTRGDLQLVYDERVTGGIRALTAYIRKFVKQMEEERMAENGSGLGFTDAGDFEDWSFYASTKKSKKSESATKSFNSMIRDVRTKNNQKKVM